MRVLRSTLVAATAIFAAACGDKVTVPPAQVVNQITSVTVAPASATISVGQTVTLVAAVNAAAGVTPTITWSSSSAAATVNAGTVTGVSASPGVAICATATAGTQSVEGCAQVVVQPPQQVVPAVLQIASITNAGNLNSPVPVPPGAVAGQINVSINLNPGTEKMDSVVVMVNGKSSGTQSFSSAQAAALRSAANAAGADQALQSTLVFSINTAAYAPTTGAVTYPNGPAAISVVGYGHQGTSAATNTTSQGVNLLFGNTDAWIVGMTIGTSKTANNAAGFAFTTGSIAVTAIPVLYSGGTIGTASVQYGSNVCDNSGIGPRVLALAAPAAGSFAWTATFPDASQTTASNNSTNRASVNSYEYNSGCGSNASGGEGPFVSASQYTNTNSGPAGTGSFALGSVVPVTRLDNRAPTGLTLAANAGTRTNSWFNDAVILNGTTAASAANGIVSAVADNGVGGVVLTATVGGNVITSTASLAESATNTAYTLSEGAVDALGNSATAVTETFGVDRTPPVLTFITQPGNNKAFAADPATGFSFGATDNTTTAGAAPSGFFNLAATPLVESEAARNAAGTTWWCPTTVAYQKSNVACAAWIGTTTTYASNLVSTDNGVGNNYFTTSATVSDQAGNVSLPATNLFAVDAVAPVIGGISFPPFFTAGGAATFTSAITTTGLDIALSRMNLAYAALAFTGGPAAPSTFWQPDVVVDAYNAATLQTSAPFSVTVSPALTNVQVAGAGGANPAAVGSPLTSVNAFALNQVPTSSAVSTSAITGASLPTPAAITNTGAAGAGPVNFLICATGNGAGAACANPPAAPAAAVVNLSKSGAGALPTSVSITAVAEGLTSVFNNPFSSVQFWAYDPTAGATQGWRLISTVTNSSTVTDGGLGVPSGRNWQFTTVWTPGATTAPDNGATYTIVAIGIAGTNLPTAQQGMALGTPVGTVTVNVAP